MATPSIKTWHIVISGFTQNVDRMTGLMRLMLHMGAEHRGPDTTVELRRWCDDWDALAEFIHLQRNGEAPRVFIYAYSYGAGWGFVRLARELQERGILVAAAVLSDPVYRSPYLSGRWRSVAPFWRPTIKIPSNVGTVWSYRQDSKPWWQIWEPRGHDVKADDPKATRSIQVYNIPDVSHAYMDDLPLFHEQSLEVARGEAV